MLRPHLADRFTVIAIDRRGRGDSTDSPEYALERECDDVAAVVRSLTGWLVRTDPAEVADRLRARAW